PFVVKSLKVDIIIECFTAPISTLMSPLWTKIPVVGLPSSFNAHSFSSKYHLPFYLIEQYGARLYKYFLPFTQYHEDKMKQLNRNIISSVVPEGVTEDFFTINRKTPKYILFLGRMDIHQKGIDLLLESYARIADRISYPLVIAGNGPDETSVKELVYKKGLKKQVTFIGPTYGDKKRRVLSEAACVAFTSRYESFSVFALEALASGVPFVCYDIPGLSWINTPFVNKIKPYDTTQFGNAIEQVSSKKNVGLTSGLRSFARKFTWEKTVDKYEAFFNTIVHQETYKFRLSHNHLNR
ncbi:glycosyltransferase family 4 protein, partial [Candidatus Roizmanbacteria bacterium]|nr:glycosyltransferase family 4 protein [Candidatus Roizmanbacteria bacterium]